MTLSLSTQLDNAVKAHMHVSDMRPAVAALYWERERVKALLAMVEARRQHDPEALDEASRDLDYALAARNRAWAKARLARSAEILERASSEQVAA